MLVCLILTISISDFDSRWASLRQTAVKLGPFSKRDVFSLPCDAEHLTAEFPEALGHLIIHSSLGAFCRCAVTAWRAGDR